MNQEQIVKELNKLIEGQYMGIHSYENFIDSIVNPKVRDEFIAIQKIHKEHVNELSDRVHELGGKAANSLGVVGTITEFAAELSGYPTKTNDILKGAIKGEHMGLQSLEKFLTNETDPITEKVVEKILSKDRTIVDRLKSLMKN